MHMQGKREGNTHLYTEALRGPLASQHQYHSKAAVGLQAKQSSMSRGSIPATSLLKSHQIQTLYNIYRNNF